MTKTTQLDKIIFVCRCQNTIDGTNDDTLMAEGNFEKSQSRYKHATFLQQSPFDIARHIEMIECLNCGINFMTMVRDGDNEIPIYTCDCGYHIMHSDYMKELAKRNAKK